MTFGACSGKSDNQKNEISKFEKSIAMKLSQTLSAIAVATMMAFSVNAQVSEGSRVKILPSGDEGVIKLLFAMKTDETVDVKFYADGGMVKSDRITGGPYEKGLMKRYDVSAIDDRDYWVEVTSANIKVTYRVHPNRDRKTFTPHLESVIFTNAALAKRN